PNKVDHFSYEDGLLIWYSNGKYGDNNSSEHPGGGANLPVDANPETLMWEGDGTPSTARGRLQTFDSTFDVDETVGLSLTKEVEAGDQSLDVSSGPSVPVFDDSDPDAYYDADGGQGWYSTRVSGLGAMIQVVSSDESTGTMVLEIGKRFVSATSQARISGSAKVGSTLTSHEPSWFQSGVDTSLTWLRDGKAIKGATKATYRVQPADAGHRISVSAVGSKAGYTSTTVSSPTTSKVAKAKVGLSVKTGKARSGKKVSVTIKASSGSLTVPGKVKLVYAGKNLGSKTLKNGKTKPKLPKKQKSGTYKLKVSYLGASGFDKAKKTVTVKVK
ncbi:MAG: hypothetical protein WBP61_04570, partial [Nocardioides sp.]